MLTVVRLDEMLMVLDFGQREGTTEFFIWRNVEA